jgi:hypothetical protein
MHRAPARSRALVALVGLGALALAFGACSGGSSKAKTHGTKAAPITSSVSLRVTGATVESAGPAVAFPTDLRNEAAQLVNQYVESAVVTALRTGVPAADLTTLFGPDAAGKLNGPDRGVLTDEGVPKATGSITSSSADTAFTALADTSGQIVLVSASLSLNLQNPVAGGTLHVVRTGDLLLAPDGGPWKIAGYDLQVLRAGPGVQASKAPRRAVLAA